MLSNIENIIPTNWKVTLSACNFIDLWRQNLQVETDLKLHCGAIIHDMSGQI